MLNSVVNIAIDTLFYHLPVLIVPGPNFILVTQFSLLESRKAGVVSAIGITTGILLHTILTLNIFIAAYSFPAIYYSLRYIGSLYLFYLGCKFLGFYFPYNLSEITLSQRAFPFKTSLLLEITNPFISVYYFTYFTYIFGQDADLFDKGVALVCISIVVFLWFSLIAIVISKKSVQTKLLKQIHWIRIISAVLMFIYAILLFFKL